MTRRGIALAAALLAVPLAGCAGAGGGGVNPALLSPKVVLDVRLDGVPVVFVHSAFGERAYDRIEVALDNGTARESILAYSLETPLNRSSFFLEVRVRAGESRFAMRGTVALDAERDRAEVALLSESGEWSAPRTFGLPYERILDRLGESA